jgi:hypothetical protein
MPSVRDRMTPLFWGGSLTSPAFLPRPQREGRFETANHNKLRQIEESGFAALLDLAMPHPPLCARGNLVRSGWHKKHPIIRLSQATTFRSANRTARHGFGNSSGLAGNKLASLKRETRFAAGFPIAFHRNQR